jgi:hypothetical protein
MPTKLGTAVLLLLCLIGRGARAEEADSQVPPEDYRFTAQLGIEATVVGFSVGPRLDLLYRLGGPGSFSHLRLTAGALVGPEFVYVPVGIGYRASFRQTKTVQPLVGLGTEVHMFLVSGHVFRQWGVVYLEAGSGFAVTKRVSLGAIATVEWAMIGEPGPGLAARLFGGYRF